ncbi:DgyrCDS939 [Dimorphilus gyrociliatus]|uniref:DgyrCDS939 n=1 Tax=Dimorphilus gyrociliatus TaxID=2664684 RepID=A0A7I8V7L3_9ANNE|nr:DgyrCDS939 [Dimorphilus gyrociliatus]
MMNLLRHGLLLYGISYYTSLVYSENQEYKLKQKLFKNYDPTVRPVKDVRTITKVAFSYSLGFIESLSWKDEFLSWDFRKENVTSIVTTSDKIWMPEMSLRNGMEAIGDLSFRGKNRIRIFFSGAVIFITNLQVKTSCLVNIQRFPHDIQVCHIEFVTISSNIGDVSYEPLNQSIKSDFSTSNSEWIVINSKIGSKTSITPEMANLTLSYVSLVLQRKSLYYNLILTGPLFLITLVSFCTFLLPCESGEKISLGISVLLSYSVLTLMMSEVLPKNSEKPPMLSSY